MSSSTATPLAWARAIACSISGWSAIAVGESSSQRSVIAFTRRPVAAMVG